MANFPIDITDFLNAGPMSVDTAARSLRIDTLPDSPEQPFSLVFRSLPPDLEIEAEPTPAPENMIVPPLIPPPLHDSGGILASDFAANGQLLPSQIAENGQLLPFQIAENGQLLPFQIAENGQLLPIAAGEAAKSGPNQQHRQPLLQTIRSILSQAVSSDSDISAVELSALPEVESDSPLPATSRVMESALLQYSAPRGAAGMDITGPLNQTLVNPEQSLSQFQSALTSLQASPTVSPEQSSVPRLLSVDIPVADRGWGGAVGERLTWMLGEQVQRAELRLTPPHLGPIEIKLSVNNDQASVSFTAHHGLTRDAIEAAIPRLREMLQQENINLVDVNVEQGNNGRNPNAGYSGRGGPNPSDTDPTSFGADDVMGTQSSPVRMSQAGLLDDYA